MHLIGDRNSNKRGITVPCFGETRNRCQKSLEMASYCVIQSKKKEKEFVKLCPKTKSNFISYKKLNSICYTLCPSTLLYMVLNERKEKRTRMSIVVTGASQKHTKDLQTNCSGDLR